MASLVSEWSVRELFGMPVLDPTGRVLGRLDGIVHHPDGRHSALVVSRPRWFTAAMVLLEGAEVSGGAIHLDPLAAYQGDRARGNARVPTDAS